MSALEFDYSISLSQGWPPPGRPTPPFGPTAVEIIRSCPLRSCFDASPGYERRMGVAARIGSAFHCVLQSLNQQPIQASETQAIAAEARQRFDQEIRKQKAEAALHSREALLHSDFGRTDQAVEAIVAEAVRIQSLNKHNRPTHFGFFKKSTSSNPPVEVEVPVQSNNGLFKGRVDRAERTSKGITLLDYKSAMRVDLPGRYERQLQLYALMWKDTRGEWPIQAQVFYPLKGVFHEVDVDPQICKTIAKESSELIAKLEYPLPAAQFALPGAICKVCEYRPWCQPFWVFQASNQNHMEALQAAALGFEGAIYSLSLSNNYWRLQVTWRNANVKLITPEERLPHLHNAQAGMRVRVLDTRLHGLMYQPTAEVTEFSEVFLVRP